MHYSLVFAILAYTGRNDIKEIRYLQNKKYIITKITINSRYRTFLVIGSIKVNFKRREVANYKGVSELEGEQNEK